MAKWSGSTQANCNAVPGPRGMGTVSLLWVACGPRKRYVIVAYMIKRSRRVLGVMRCNERIRMQQSQASGAVSLWRHGHLSGSPEGPWGVPRRSQEFPGGPRDAPGIPGLLFTR